MPDLTHATAEEVAAEVEEVGYAVVPNFINANRVAALLRELADIFDGIGSFDSEQIGQQTHHTHNLLEKTRTVDALAMDPRRTNIIRAILGPDIQISSVVASRPSPGNQPQLLHQDDGHLPIPRPHMPLVATRLTALDPFTEENGATRVVPGSHRSTGSVDQNAETVAVEMDAGSMYVMHAAFCHAGGGNMSEDRFRRSIIINYNLAWLKQRENQFIGVPPEIAVEMPEGMQRLIGYQVTNSNLGTVDYQNPIETVKRRLGVSHLSLGFPTKSNLKHSLFVW